MTDEVKERCTALAFAHKWLWENPGRRTVDREWPSDYINDAVAMMVDYRRKHQSHADSPVTHNPQEDAFYEKAEAEAREKGKS